MFDVLRCIASIVFDDGSREEILSIAIHNLAFHPQSRRKRFSPNSDPSIWSFSRTNARVDGRSPLVNVKIDSRAKRDEKNEKLCEKFVKQTHKHMESEGGKVVVCGEKTKS